MHRDSNIRSIVKGISWRVFATTVTIMIVYIFFGRLDLAIFAGIIETVAKIVLYWFHERIWIKVKWGRKKIKPFNIWFTGLPLSGKTTIANEVFKDLSLLDIPIERLDSKDIRELIPNIGYSRSDRNRHIYRVAHLIKTLQNNSISTVSSFVSPYEESREIVKKLIENNIIIYIKADIETCKARDKKGKYKKAIRGELENFTGISDTYEKPIDPNLVIDTDKVSINSAKSIIVEYIKREYIK